MDRRIFLAASASTLLTQLNDLAFAQTRTKTPQKPEKGLSLGMISSFTGLQKSSRMPVLFVGHGSPMNAITDNEYRRSWEDLGDKFGTYNKVGVYPKPQLILCISAHWITEGKGWYLTGMDKPPTIHDFG